MKKADDSTSSAFLYSEESVKRMIIKGNDALFSFLGCAHIEHRCCL